MDGAGKVTGDMVVLALGLGSALTWGVADFLGGVANRRFPLASIVVPSQLVGVVICAVAILATAQEPPGGATLAFALVAGGANALGLGCFYRALAAGKMSIVAPIVGMSAILPLTIALAGGERPAAPQLLGMVAAVAGVSLAARERDTKTGASSPGRATYVLAVLAALGVGGNLAGIGAAVNSSAEFPLLWTLLVTRATAALILAAGALVVARAGVHVSREAWHTVLALGTLDLAANALFAIGGHAGLVSLTAVLASLHPVATVLLARAVLGERLRGVQQAGVALAIAGAMLLAT